MAQQQKISTIVMILVITMATHYGGVTAQFMGCATVITSMPSCASFIAGSTLTAPPGCCTEFASVIKSQPQCLCQVFNSTASFMGLSNLPKVCNVDTPSECNASPSDSPPSGTAPSPSNSPPSGTTPSPGTNATSPSANSPPPSDATSTRYTTFPVLCLLLVAAYAMVF
nr:non-specific lipid-transfer protein-like protein At2g13820 [Tanacetum cinerariifolium]